MFSSGSTQLQIVRPVVRPDAVDVVTVLSREQGASELLREHEPMLFLVALFLGVPDLHVAVAVDLVANGRTTRKNVPPASRNTRLYRTRREPLPLLRFRDRTALDVFPRKPFPHARRRCSQLSRDSSHAQPSLLIQFFEPLFSRRSRCLPLFSKHHSTLDQSFPHDRQRNAGFRCNGLHTLAGFVLRSERFDINADTPVRTTQMLRSSQCRFSRYSCHAMTIAL